MPGQIGVMNCAGRIAVIWITALALTACEAKEIAEVKGAVAATLPDPSSARFSDVREGPGGLICGTVDGKNADGAYAGARRFVGLAAQDAIIEPDPGDPMRRLFDQRWSECTGAAPPPEAANVENAADNLEAIPGA